MTTLIVAALAILFLVLIIKIMDWLERRRRLKILESMWWWTQEGIDKKGG